MCECGIFLVISVHLLTLFRVNEISVLYDIDFYYNK